MKTKMSTRASRTPTYMNSLPRVTLVFPWSLLSIVGTYIHGQNTINVLNLYKSFLNDYNTYNRGAVVASRCFHDVPTHGSIPILLLYHFLSHRLIAKGRAWSSPRLRDSLGRAGSLPLPRNPRPPAALLASQHVMHKAAGERGERARSMVEVCVYAHEHGLGFRKPDFRYCRYVPL